VCSSYWRLYINSRAGAAVRLATGSYPITPELVHFIPAWVRFTCVCDRPVDHFYVHFDLIGLPGVVVREFFARPMALPPEPELLALFAGLRQPRPARAGHDLARHLHEKAAVYAALARLVAGLPPDQAERCGVLARGDHPVQPALSYLEQHLDQPLTNAELAAHCHYSEDHFARLFRQTIGQSPAQYVIERRVSRAAQLLLYSSATIEQIAARTGFPNRFYFTRVFTQRLGVSPAAYRHTTRV
jgi:AraC-like DNA-binding protein